MFSTNYQKNHARQLLGLALTTIVLTTLVVCQAGSVTQQRTASALGPQGQTKRRRVQSITQRQLDRVGQNKRATGYPAQPQTPASKANGKIAFNEIVDRLPLVHGPTRSSKVSWVSLPPAPATIVANHRP